MMKIHFNTSVCEEAESLTINIISMELALALSEISIFSSFESKIEYHEASDRTVIIESNLYTDNLLEKWVILGIIQAAIEDFLEKKLETIPKENVFLISKNIIDILRRNKDTEIFIYFKDKIYLLNLLEDKLEALEVL